MIVTTGEIIKVEAGSELQLHFEKSAETPGLVTLRIGKDAIGLPGHPKDADAFVKAYLRVVAHDVGYRKSGVE